MEGKILSLILLVLVLVLEYKVTSADICASSPTILNSPTGNFSSPNYPTNYPHNTNKTWKIEAPIGQVIDLYFTTFALERSSSCLKDYVKIRGKCDDVPMAIYCDHTARPLRSTSNVLWVEFRSDARVNDKGFEALYKINSNSSKLLSCPRPSDNSANIDYCFVGDQVQCCNNNDRYCRVNKIVRSESGTIRSPGFPGYYPSGTVYLWRITVPEGYVVQINFTTLETNHGPLCSDAHSKCKCDYVHVLDGPCLYNIGTQWCGAWTSRNLYPSFTTTGRHMVVIFRSDDYFNDIGFVANYRLALNCSGNKPISCMKNSLPSCCIKEARTCASQTSIRSHCPRDGDPASYEICCTVNGSPTCCHNPLSSICADTPTILNRAGNISSPNYPNQYPNHAKKIWKIVAPSDKVIDFYFESFELEYTRFDCDSDFVQIRNSCNDTFPVARYCGKTADSFRSASNVLWVEFRSDSTITKKGFAAFFVSVPKSSKRISCPRPSDDQANIDYCFNGKDIECCNKNTPICRYDKLLTAPNGTFTSPNYPNDYPPNTNYTWRITVPEGFLVQLNFTKFKIHKSDFFSSCNGDYVSVRDGPCSNTDEKKWCTSEKKLPSYISTGRHLLVFFKSDSAYSLDGFEAHYRRALECTGETPYSCLKEGIPACCKVPEDERSENFPMESSATKTATKMWFIVITITLGLATTLI